MEQQQQMFMWAPKSELKGETLDKTYAEKNAFEVLSWEWGLENSVNMGSISGRGGAGKASFKELVLTKRIDTASSGFQTLLCQGKHIDKMVLAFRYSGIKSQSEFLRIEFKFVMVTDVTMSATPGNDSLFEDVTLLFGAYKFAYNKRGKDGKPGTGKQSTTEWSIVKNQASFEV